MKNKIFTLILIFAAFITQAQISGTVSDLSNYPIANHTMYIMGDSSTGSAGYYSTTNTSGNGYYSFSNLPSGNYIVYTYDCNQSFQSNYVSGNSGTANFQICTNSNPNPCNAAFTYYVDSMNQMTVHFINNSTGNPTSYLWNFGDGSSSTLQHPSHTYANIGTYSVLLYISSSNCSDTMYMNVIVGNTLPPCNAAFTYSTDSVNPNTIHFNNQSTPSGVGCNWSFGDGTYSAVQNPTHQYSTPGTYIVSLTVGTALCTDSMVQQITIGNPANCQAAFSYMPDSANPNTIHFFDLSTGNPNNYTWNFGDGNSSNTQNPTHTYNSSGNFIVTLLISGPNCQSTTSQSVSISGSSTSYTLSGTVKDSLNQPKAFCGLILFDLQGIPLKSAITSGNGTYSMYNVPTGSYKLLASPDSTMTPNQTYAPTYYGNTTIWTSATTIQLSANMSQLDIQLLPYGTVTGNGTISGNVGNGVKGGLPNILVNLLDHNLNPLRSTTTDGNGNYSFTNLAMGSYKIWVEIPGKTTTPIDVTLSTGNSNSQTNNFLVTGNTVVPRLTSISNATSDISLKIYPNPVDEILNLKLSSVKAQKVQISIVDLNGRVINTYQQEVSQNTVMQINLSRLQQGMYMIRVQGNDFSAKPVLFSKK